MTAEARAIEQSFFEDSESIAYDRLWDVLDRILADPVAAPTRPWARYVSTFRLWGTKVPGTDVTVFWRISDETLHVAHILTDADA